MQSEMTRTDIPTARAAVSDVSSRTQVIPSIRDDSEVEFESQRKAKIQQFMQNSFAAESQSENDDFADEDDMSSISQFFGGLKRSDNIGEPEQKKKKSADLAFAPKADRFEEGKKTRSKGGKKAKPKAEPKEKKPKKAPTWKKTQNHTTQKQ